MSGSAPILETRGLTRFFGPVRVTGDVDFTLHPGERRAIIGPNGAGKTTFVNLLSGRLAPSSGQVFLGGENVTAMSEARRIKLGLGRTFQITSLFPNLSVRKNVFLAVAEHEGVAWNLFRSAASHRRQFDRVDELLDRVGLSDVAEVPAQDLPYGRQRLLEIAVTLALRPRVLLLDEPAAGIPTSESHIILSILDTLPKDIAVLLIDHDMDLVFRFAQRITVLVQGSVMVEGTPAEIAANERVRKIYLGESDHAAA
ncbi:ABC transporter ATP-binding protein [Magnetospirillum sp. SS-4]|uniref:ABC transporter ATP-binding protein n=1 Tax=Magnetospirillum sp. SS-4 TaxID=2681465 RepID=UPI001385CBEC|nr:ABC transporter ATP-binding protein [Magnetospirillum sp. SS-4]CAA7625017.1 ABC transporter [Magnetospirillum sp. SS-4]